LVIFWKVWVMTLEPSYHPNVGVSQ